MSGRQRRLPSRRQLMLEELRLALHEHGGDGFVRVLSDSLRAAAADGGMAPTEAFGVAVRCCHVVVYLLGGRTQKEAAALLGVSPSTVKLDVARIRRVMDAGRLRRRQPTLLADDLERLMGMRPPNEARRRRPGGQRPD